MSQTADRYAKALFELSKEQNNLEAVQNSMTDIEGTYSQFRKFPSVFGQSFTFLRRTLYCSKSFV